LKRKENEDYFDTNTNFTPFQFKVDRWYLKTPTYSVVISHPGQYLRIVARG
jgi:hypothetical protein